MKRLLMSCGFILVLAVSFLLSSCENNLTGNDYEWVVDWYETSHNATNGNSVGYFLVAWADEPYCDSGKTEPSTIILVSTYYSLSNYVDDYAHWVHGLKSPEISLESGRSYNFKFKRNNEIVASITFLTPSNPVVDFPETFDPEEDNTFTWSLDRDSSQQSIWVQSHYYADNLQSYWYGKLSPSARSITIPQGEPHYFGVNTSYELGLVETNIMQNDEILMRIPTYSRLAWPLEDR
jgi:hypothetical protein